MITKETLDAVTAVYYHESCPDGTAAAMICKVALFRDGVKFYSIQHGTELMEKLEPRPNQLFVDITPPSGRWEEWRAVAPVVLDHHVTTRHVTEGLGGVYGLNETHSGALLAYDHVLSPLAGSGALLSSLMGSQELAKWRDFAELAMIRDTWKKDHPRWKEACAQAMALQFHGSKKLIELVGAGDFPFEGLAELGAMLFDQAERKTKVIAKGAYVKEVETSAGRLKISFFNCTEKLISDAANLLLEQGSDVAIGYFHLFEDGEMRVSVSVRTAGRVLANKIATFYGGGGHDRAAGFRLKVGEAPGPDELAEKVRLAI